MNGDPINAQRSESNQSSVMKELSDIKSNLAVNSNETKNIKDMVGEIKTDLRIIKNDFVTRRELTETITTVKEEINPLRKFVYGLASVVLLGVAYAVINLVLK